MVFKVPSNPNQSMFLCFHACYSTELDDTEGKNGIYCLIELILLSVHGGP